MAPVKRLTEQLASTHFLDARIDGAQARRMAETAAQLVEHVLPEQPIRQWVLSFPYPLRILFATRPAVLTQVLGIVYRAVSTFLVRRAGLRVEAQTACGTAEPSNPLLCAPGHETCADIVVVRADRARAREFWCETFEPAEAAWRSKASRFNATGKGRTSTALQRVDDRQSGETRKIAVGRPEHTHPVIAAKSGNSGVVHDPTLQEGGSGDSLQCIEIAFAFSQKSAGKTRKEPSCGIQSFADRCRVPEDSRVGDNRKKLVDARPGNGHRLRPAHGRA